VCSRFYLVIKVQSLCCVYPWSNVYIWGKTYDFCKHSNIPPPRTTLIKKSNGITYRNTKINLKIHIETQKITNKLILSKKNNAGCIIMLNLKLYYRAIVIKKQHGNGTKTDMKTNGIEQKTLTQTHATTAIWFLTKVPKICIGEKIASSTNSARKTEFPPAEDWN
jgi:hypothetical protein